MDKQRADELVTRGELTPDWRPSFLAVPRLWFIPDVIWHEVGDVMRPVHRAEDPDRWRELASGEEFVVTQVDDGCPVDPDDGCDLPTSSASQPNVVALMLKHLGIQGGESVLEIGTGTGWNAALLSHRLGPQRVTTVEIDPEVATHARRALSDAGFTGVTTVTGNGSLGYTTAAPYDRVLATIGCRMCRTRGWHRPAQVGASWRRPGRELLRLAARPHRGQ
ncbi:MAG: methyltransferase domain-containing protein [Pseudonocardiaceae bacterium]|nr:methyltransferase domain-containing protein [Pseudonocardiaceae bacterium]